MSSGLPQHLVQRGNNRELCFFADPTIWPTFNWLERARALPRFDHAYVLMPNHVHLLATPQWKAASRG